MVALYKYFEEVEQTYNSVAERIGALFDKLQPQEKGAPPLSEDFIGFAAVRLANAKRQLYGPITSVPDDAREVTSGYWELTPISIDQSQSVATLPQLEIPDSRARETDFKKEQSGGVFFDTHTKENPGRQLGGIFSQVPVNRVAEKSREGAEFQSEDTPSLDNYVVGEVGKNAILRDKYAQQETVDLDSVLDTEQSDAQSDAQSQKPGEVWRQPPIQRYLRLLSQNKATQEQDEAQRMILPPRAKGRKWPFDLFVRK